SGVVENADGAVIGVAIDEVKFAIAVEISNLDAAGHRFRKSHTLQRGREEDCGLEGAVAISLCNGNTSACDGIVDCYHQVRLTIAIEIGQRDIFGPVVD